jgi:predicted lipoprotein
MYRRTLAVMCLTLLVVTISACKIVKNPSPDEIASSKMTDAERMEAFVSKNWDENFVPFYKDNAHPFNDVIAAVGNDVEAAGQKLGLRQEGGVNPWHFIVRGKGKILSANTESRAASATIDANGDNEADFVMQIGPVIRGTALRDAATFLTFSDFRDQIEYAKLGRALNAETHGRTTKALPMDTLVGTDISFLAVFSAAGSSSKLVLTPIEVEVQ